MSKGLAQGRQVAANNRATGRRGQSQNGVGGGRGTRGVGPGRDCHKHRGVLGPLFERRHFPPRGGVVISMALPQRIEMGDTIVDEKGQGLDDGERKNQNNSDTAKEGKPLVD